MLNTQSNLSAKYLYIKRPLCQMNLHNLLTRNRFPNNENSIIYLPKPMTLQHGKLKEKLLLVMRNSQFFHAITLNGK